MKYRPWAPGINQQPGNVTARQTSKNVTNRLGPGSSLTPLAFFGPNLPQNPRLKKARRNKDQGKVQPITSKGYVTRCWASAEGVISHIRMAVSDAQTARTPGQPSLRKNGICQQATMPAKAPTPARCDQPTSRVRPRSGAMLSRPILM